MPDGLVREVPTKELVLGGVMPRSGGERSGGALTSKLMLSAASCEGAGSRLDGGNGGGISED